MSGEKREKALSIIRENALLRGNFILSSGQASNFYIDLKKVCMRADFLSIIADLIVDKMEEEGWAEDIWDDKKAIGGIELGGVPLVSAVLIKLSQKGKNAKGVIVRKKPKEHGTSKWIEGDENIEKAIIIEDVSTTGETTLRAIEKLKENGISTEGVIVVVDRGGIEKIREKGIRAVSIFSVEEIVEEKSSR